MCWKKKPPVIPITGDKVALLFAIDDYPGTQNDLPDCVLDQTHIAAFLATNYPEFIVKKFKNSEVTRSNFENTIKAQIAILKAGDVLLIYYSGHGTNGLDSNESDGYREGLYLWNGTFWDDEFTVVLQPIPLGAKVIIVLDSCFAQGSTTTKNSKLRKPRFVQTQEIKKGAKRLRPILKSDTMNYIVFAACQENQTASSTGRGGVFTLHWEEAWRRHYTYRQWSYMTAQLLRDDNETQISNIEGDENLMGAIIFT